MPVQQQFLPRGLQGAAPHPAQPGQLGAVRLPCLLRQRLWSMRRRVSGGTLRLGYCWDGWRVCVPDRLPLGPAAVRLRLWHLFDEHSSRCGSGSGSGRRSPSRLITIDGSGHRYRDCRSSSNCSTIDSSRSLTDSLQQWAGYFDTGDEQPAPGDSATNSGSTASGDANEPDDLRHGADDRRAAEQEEAASLHVVIKLAKRIILFLSAK